MGEPPVTPPPLPTMPPSLAPEPPARPKPVYYKVNSWAASYGELWRNERNPLVVILWLTKLLHLRLPGSITEPNVETFSSLETTTDRINADDLAKLQPTIDELKAAGFTDPLDGPTVYQHIDTFSPGRFQIVPMVHRDHLATVARAWKRVELQKPRYHADLITQLADGRFLWSTNARTPSDVPPAVIVRMHYKKSFAEMWDAHRTELAGLTRAGSRIATQADVRDLLDRHHATMRDFHLQRKVFTPAPQPEAPPIEGLAPQTQLDPKFEQTLAELHRLQTKKASWTQAILILVVSVALFAGLGARNWDVRFALILLGILFVHELGHYLTMMAFGYRNLRMFFIPLFGAAVTGQNYNVAGWKKVVVALAGPLPGIVLGIAVGVVSYFRPEIPHLNDVAMLAIIINAFNLLPILPLDGGHVMHTLLFARHPIADVAFRAVAGGLLIFVSFGMLHDKFLGILGGLMLLGIPTAHKIAQLTAELRRQGFSAHFNTQTVPAPIAMPVIERVAEKFPKLTPKMWAQQTLGIVENINARSPGVLASLFWAAVQGGALLLAIMGGVGIFFIKNTDIGAIVRGEVRMPEKTLSISEVRESSVADRPAVTIVVPLPDRTPTVDPVFGSARGRAWSTQIGQHFLLHSTDPADREALLALGDSIAPNAFVATPKRPARLQLMAIVLNEQRGKDLHERLDTFLRFSPKYHLIPPWAENVSDEQQRAFLWARKTLNDLQTAGFADDLNENGSSSNPEEQKLYDQMAEARRRGDEDETRRLSEALTQRSQQKRKDALEVIRTDATGKYDPQVVEKYLELSHADADSPEAVREKERLQIGPLLGQMAAAVETPTTQPAIKLNYTEYLGRGHAQLNKAMLVIYVDLEDPAHEPLQILRWLQEQQAGGFRYELDAGFTFDGE